MTFTLDLTDLAATESFGRRFGAVLTPGTIVALNGPLGAGKTHLVRAIAEGLEVKNPAAVNSPTFVLIQEYQARLPIFHFDAYRLSGPREFDALGVEEYFAAGGVCLIEWAEKVVESMPADRIEIRIEITGPTARRFFVSANGPNATKILDRFRQLESPADGR